MGNMFWFDQAPDIDRHKHPHGVTRKPVLNSKQAESDKKRLLKLSKKLIKQDRLRGKTINIRKNKVTRVQISRENRKWRPDKTRVKRFADELYEFHDKRDKDGNPKKHSHLKERLTPKRIAGAVGSVILGNAIGSSIINKKLKPFSEQDG